MAPIMLHLNSPICFCLHIYDLWVFPGTVIWIETIIIARDECGRRDFLFETKRSGQPMKQKDGKKKTRRARKVRRVNATQQHRFGAPTAWSWRVYSSRCMPQQAETFWMGVNHDESRWWFKWNLNIKTKTKNEQNKSGSTPPGQKSGFATVVRWPPHVSEMLWLLH